RPLERPARDRARTTPPGLKDIPPEDDERDASLRPRSPRRGVRSGSLAFARPNEKPGNKQFGCPTLPILATPRSGPRYHFVSRALADRGPSPWSGPTAIVEPDLPAGTAWRCAAISPHGLASAAASGSTSGDRASRART